MKFETIPTSPVSGIRMLLASFACGIILLVLASGCQSHGTAHDGQIGSTATGLNQEASAVMPEMFPEEQSTGQPGEAGEVGGLQELLQAVVRIDVREARYEDGSRRLVRGVGSGVIMTAAGHILTNAHVASPKAEYISVTLANLERVEAQLIGWDHWTDLALIQLDKADLESRGLSFSVATFGDSDNVYPGQTVYAAGTPNGLSRTVTKGIISNNNRYFESGNRINGHETGWFNTWLQTDAAINPGNSGGPLVDVRGQVVGINTSAYLGANNLAFAVPANTAKEVMAGLLDNGNITRSYIGIKPGPLQDLETFYQLEVNRGMLINNVDPGSPASAAGIRAGDIILTIDGEEIDGRFPEQLPAIRQSIARRPVGSDIALEIKRGDSLLNATVTTEELKSRVGEQIALEQWGLSLEKISRAVAREYRLDSEDGALVIGTQPAYPASEAGLRRGDIITEVNDRSIQSLEPILDAYDRYTESPQKVLLEVMRQYQVSYLIIKP